MAYIYTFLSLLLLIFVVVVVVYNDKPTTAMLDSRPADVQVLSHQVTRRAT